MAFARKLSAGLCFLACLKATFGGVEDSCEGNVCTSDDAVVSSSMLVRGVKMENVDLSAGAIREEHEHLDGRADDADDDGQGRRFGDVDVAKAALLQEATAREEAAHEEFLNSFQAILDASLGADGVSVIRGFDIAEVPCPSNSYLHETFVHVDMRTGTFVCKPCHSSCASDCSGPSGADCFSVTEPQSIVGVSSRTRSRSAFANSFAHHFQAHMSMLSTGNVSGNISVVDELDIPENLSQCIDDGSCSVTVTNLSESSSPNISTVTVELVMATAIPGEVTDPTTLKTPVQKAVNDALQAVGFIPGMTSEPPLFEEIDNITAVDEDGAPDTELDSSSPMLQPGSWLQTQRSCEEATQARLNHTTKALTDYMKRRIKNTAKDHVMTESKKAANDFAKQSLRNWIEAQDGDCLDGLDTLIGASQLVYACFKDNYANIKKAFCGPADEHEWLTKNLVSVLNMANLLKTISKPMKVLPYVGSAANTVYNVATSIRATLDKPVQSLKAMKMKPYIGMPEQPGCCYPFPEPSGTCLKSPGAAYRCASCASGNMCYADRGCNTIIKLEEKVNTWKQKFYDPLLEKIAEATQHVQAANNAGVQAANAASWLAKCQGGSFNMCSEVKALADKLSNAIGSSFTEKHCPIAAPNIPFPDIGPIRTVLGWLGKIGDVFKSIELELMKDYCVNVPMVESWMERECSRVCTPCCSYHGRRRWTGGIRCSSCCHNVCVLVPKARAYTKKFCFSAMKILKGIGGLIQDFLGPILSIIDKVIDVLLTPIRALFDQILKKLGLNVDFAWPPVPSFEFHLPALPAVDCNALKNFVA